MNRANTRFDQRDRLVGHLLTKPFGLKNVDRVSHSKLGSDKQHNRGDGRMSTEDQPPVAAKYRPDNGSHRVCYGCRVEGPHIPSPLTRRKAGREKDMTIGE